MNVTTATLPLLGLTFLNTRDPESAPALSEPLRLLGAHVIERPAIAFLPPESWLPFDAALAALRPGQWIVLTSATAVRFTLWRLRELGRDGAALNAAKIAAIGAGTAQALSDRGLRVRLVPERFQAEGLLEALAPRIRPGDPVWHPRAEEARPMLEDGIRAAGAVLTVTPVYRTVQPPEGLGEVSELLGRGEIHWICFTSASTVRNFWGMLPGELRPSVLAGPRIACLGRISAEAARQLGFSVAAQPMRQDIAGLVEAIAAAVPGEPAAARGLPPAPPAD